MGADSCRSAWRLSWRLVTALLLLALGVADAAAQNAQYRGYWVDTFNTTLNTPADVTAVVQNAVASNANAIFVQVRRRGDAWYLNSLEPPPDLVPIEPGFDPLQAIITEAHQHGLEVHAFVIMGAIWNRHPVILGPPSSPNHVFNLHGGYDPVTQTIVPGPDNWLTRTLLPGFTFNGHRFGSDFWLDFGHPGAALYSVDVLLHLLQHYDIDGIHLDRIRFPEFTASGQTPANGTNIGYNQTSIERFQRRYGIAPGSPPPAQNDPLWNQWRRDQVTNLVRRIYLESIAVKPHVKISAALIAFGGTGLAESAWLSAEAYWRVYQDWRAWTEEGIVDLAIPMNYKREHTPSNVTMYDQWNEWTKNHAYDRAVLVGTAPYLNAIEGSLRQVRRALAPSTLGNVPAGVLFFSMANTNVALTGNPFSIPPGQNTPLRPFAEFAAALTTGRSVSGATLYEDPIAFPEAVFALPAPVPVFEWKATPAMGHLKGVVRDEAGEVVDAGDVAIARLDDGAPVPPGRTSVATATDGNGFYGGVDLAPGTVQVTVTPPGQAPYLYQCTADITAGTVTTFDFVIDRAGPLTNASIDPVEIWPPNGRTVFVTLAGEASDQGTGLASIAFRVIDEYGEVEPVVESILLNGEPAFAWSRTIPLEARRLGADRDGRRYTIEITVTDKACNTATFPVSTVVVHDQRK